MNGRRLQVVNDKRSRGVWPPWRSVWYDDGEKNKADRCRGNPDTGDTLYQFRIQGVKVASPICFYPRNWRVLETGRAEFERRRCRP